MIYPCRRSIIGRFCSIQRRDKMDQGRGIGHPIYLEEASKAINMLGDNIKILKMDVFNEITLRHPIPGGILLNLKYFISLDWKGAVVFGKERSTVMELHAIECDQNMIDKAQYMQLYEFVKITKGNISHLPYEDKYFDLVLDFSTIDHISLEDMKKTFAGYNRVLKDGGLIVLVSWCADIYKCVETDTDKHFENQYYFLVKDLKDSFQQNFNIMEEEKGYIYPYEGTNIFMYRFLGEKNEGLLAISSK